MARYIPGNVPAESRALPAFLSDELNKIAQAGETAHQFVMLDTLYAAPTKLRTGMTVLADGTTWNPGTGAGVYTYYGAAWHKLG